ncbi:hypothetical protein LAZ67_5002651 [Cordylochernes scorpioides]|uniref:Uncharacterized protein n=1 Tax=Cordylochernes scorpioides TaxID=51811 RepID=A0ABY6KLD4_9ARAC|nr:hypothetical protein LAZ67_5002651 [Cordylochernes scorpioides]
MTTSSNTLQHPILSIKPEVYFGLERVLETRLAPCVLSTGPTNFDPARSPDLTPLDFFLWGTVKDGMYKRKPRNLDILWNEIQAGCREISLDVLIRCTESVVTRTQNCIDMLQVTNLNSINICYLCFIYIGLSVFYFPEI